MSDSTSENLAQKKCKPCEGGTKPINENGIKVYLLKLAGWEHIARSSASGQGGEIVKVFSFKNYHQTMAFVNAVAWIAHQEDHHPDMEVGYKTCKVKYSTHAIGGLSENDFICAAKIDQLLK
jgi:4a-hydroxytetrahydrobiopterin dehydratase